MTAELARIALLLVMFVGYVAICVWAFAPRNRKRFEDAARLPLDPAQVALEPATPSASANGEPRR